MRNILQCDENDGNFLIKHSRHMLFYQSLKEFLPRAIENVISKKQREVKVNMGVTRDFVSFTSKCHKAFPIKAFFRTLNKEAWLKQVNIPPLNWCLHKPHCDFVWASGFLCARQNRKKSKLIPLKKLVVANTKLSLHFLNLFVIN